MALQHLRSNTANKRPAPGSMADGQLAINTAASSPGLFYKDAAGALVKVGPVHVGTTAPNASPASGGTAGNSVGEQWLDTTGGTYVFKVWDGSAWRSESGTFVDASGDTMTGALVMDNQQQVRFRETTANGTNYIALQAPASVASDKTITLPDQNGSVLVSGNASIVNADVSATAAIAGTKIAPDFGSQAVTTTGTSTAASFIPTSSTVPTNGVYLPSAGSVAISTGGSGRLFIDSSGSVGVNTNTSSIFSIGKLVVQNGSTSADERFMVAANAYLSGPTYTGTYIQQGDTATTGTSFGLSNTNLGRLIFQNTSAGLIGCNAGVPLVFGTSGTERLRITSSGLVGVGTSTVDPGHILQANGVIASVTPFGAFTALQTAGGTGFRWTLANNGTFRLQRTTDGFSTVTTPIFVDSSDRVGVGATTFADNNALLHVSKDASGGTGGSIVIRNGAANASGNMAELVFKTSSGFTNGFNSAKIAAIQPSASEAADLAFYTYGSGTGSERLRITAAGLVGIGTSSPSQPLQVVGAIASTAQASSLTASSAFIDYNASFNGARIGSVGNTTGAAGPIYFSQYSSNASVGRDAVVIDSSGRVGIGTTSASHPLDVQAGTSEVRIRSTTTSAGAAPRLIFDHAGNDAFGIVGGTELRFLTSNTTERARIDSSGRLLVGTSTSVGTLSGLGATLQVNEGSGVAASLLRSTNDVSGANLVFRKTRDTTPTGVTVVQNNDTLGRLVWVGTDGTNPLEAARITAEVDGTPGANNMPGRIVLSTTAAGASSPTEHLRITQDGVMCYSQPTPVSYSGSATLTITDLKNGIILSTGGGGYTLTLPTGTLTEGGFSNVYTDMTFEWSVICTAASNITIGAGTNHTIVGLNIVLAGSSGRFASRRTAANTFVTYRLSS